jgi:hypothetical protein
LSETERETERGMIGRAKSSNLVLVHFERERGVELIFLIATTRTISAVKWLEKKLILKNGTLFKNK